MKIGELAARASLNASAIRYYEKMGLLAAPQRIGGQRRYPSDALHRVLLIRFATDMGFTLAEIKLFLSGLRDNAPVGPAGKNSPPASSPKSINPSTVLSNSNPSSRASSAAAAPLSNSASIASASVPNSAALRTSRIKHR